jgi:hypothetical protein
VQRVRRSFSSRSFQTDDAVNFLFLLQQAGDGVRRRALVALVIDGLHDLHTGIFL